MKNIFDLRDLEFREYFYKNLFVCYTFGDKKKKVFSILDGEVSDGDLMKFYFEFSKFEDEYISTLHNRVAEILFNYKMYHLDDLGVIKFADIIEKRVGFRIISAKISYDNLHGVVTSYCSTKSSFYKMVDIFLDEV